MRSKTLRALALAAATFTGLATVPAKAEIYAFMLAANNDIGVLGLSNGKFKLCGNPGIAKSKLEGGETFFMLADTFGEKKARGNHVHAQFGRSSGGIADCSGRSTRHVREL